MRKLVFHIHWLLGVTAGLVLAIVGITGAMMSFERPIMEAISPSIVRVEVVGERLSPDALIERFHSQQLQARVEQVTFWPDAQRSAQLRLAPKAGERRGESLYINPYSGAVLGKITGEQFFQTVRSLHRWLLIPSQEGSINIGRQITGFCAFSLLFFALSGLYLRWPRRALNWRNWFCIDFSLKGRNFYWALHSVIGTWVLVIYLLLALTGLTWSYSWFKNGAALLLTGEPVQERRSGPGGREAGPGMRADVQVQPASASVDLAWKTFVNSADYEFRFASVTVPRSAADPVLISYVAPDANSDRHRSAISINAHSGAVLSEQPYMPQTPLGKRIMQGIYELHTGEWFGTPGLIINMLASLLMPLFTITGLLLYIDRRHKKRKTKRAAAGISTAHTDADYWIVYASQTGTAEQLAWRTVTILQAGGIKASVKNIAALDKATIESAQKMLFLVSTFGEGEAPDAARGFARKLLRSSLGLSQLQFAVLGLGDKRYSDYCAFAEQVERWLQACGATPLFARINVDNGDEQAIQAWQKTIADISGVKNVPTWAAPEYEEWRLQKRQLLNEGSVGSGIYCVSLQPPKPGGSQWQAGDILEIKPHNNLALPQREYSIASLATDGRLDLVVRQTFTENGEPGLGSGWLTTAAAESGVVLARIRSNPSFHAPLANCPMILLGAGTGIAGLRAHLHERYLSDVQQNWLIFGERQRSKDRLFASELDAWQQSGFLTEVDEVYSRDGEGYVQDVLRSKQQQLCEWLDRGAAIYVCGGVAMGRGVHQALVEILGENDLQQLIESHRYRRDVY